MSEPNPYICGDCCYLHKRSDGTGGCGFYHQTVKRYLGVVTEWNRVEPCLVDPRTPWRAQPKPEEP